MKWHRIHVTGAPGAGKTTISSAIAMRRQLKHISADDYQWKLSDPPYQYRTNEIQRQMALASELCRHKSWVLSGSIHYWGEPIYPLFDLVILVLTPKNVRLKRLLARERERFGSRIAKGGDMWVTHKEFIKKAAAYDTAPESTRGLARDKAWLELLHCPVLCIDGAKAISEILTEIDHVAAERAPSLRIDGTMASDGSQTNLC